jgi:hypothetical protein
MQKENPFNSVKKTLEVSGKQYQYYSLPDLNDARVCKFTKLYLRYRNLLVFDLKNFIFFQFIIGYRIKRNNIMCSVCVFFHKF